jgi:hypothetical protein
MSSQKLNSIKGLVCLLVLGCTASLGAEPLRLHSENGHYFTFRGQPTVLVGSSEHYGAVINRDFDYLRYLDTLQADGLNVTRIFTGVYREHPGRFSPEFDFEIVENTLAPKPERFLAPWPRTDQPGAFDGQNKFDLRRWDDAYFKRLKDFVQEAGRRGIVVEVSLFSAYYSDKYWDLSPLNAKNNINGIGNVRREDALTLKDGRLVAAQDAMVRRIVEALRGFDNVYYQICNEPDMGRVPIDWQSHIAATIKAADSGPSHLIAQEFGYGEVKVEAPVKQASIYLFHGTRTPGSIALNYHLGKPIGSNENGVDGNTEAAYRVQAWQYLIAGGALTMGLDYSFTANHEDGTFAVPARQPGGGSAALRKQLGILHSFMNGLDFIQMVPAPAVIKAGLPRDASASTLAQQGRSYAIYIHHGREVNKGDFTKVQYAVDATQREIVLTLDLPSGAYVVEWVSTKTGEIEKKEPVTSIGRGLVVASPKYSEDIVLRIQRSEHLRPDSK